MEQRTQDSDLTIVSATYKAPEFESEFADVDFSSVSIARRMKAGYEDMTRAIAEWRTPAAA